MRSQQWSLFVKWTSDGVKKLNQYRWVEGKPGHGYVIEYSYDPLKMETSTPVDHFADIEDFDDFVRWSYSHLVELNGTAILTAGCTECGTILNADAAGCTGLWHEANQSSMHTLARFMNAQFPEAVAKTKGDEALAAMHLMLTTRDLMGYMWPLLVNQFQAAATVLRQAGVNIPE